MRPASGRLGIVCLVTASLLLAGCAPLVRPASIISVERQKFINAYSRARVLYGTVAERMTRMCAQGKIEREECARMASVHEQAKALDAEIQAKLDTPESEVDWPRVMKLLELALDLAL